MERMFPDGIRSDEFFKTAAAAGLAARQTALAAGFPVVFVDKLGRYVQEMPDGRLFEVRLEPGVPRDRQIVVLGEISTRTT